MLLPNFYWQQYKLINGVIGFPNKNPDKHDAFLKTNAIKISASWVPPVKIAEIEGVGVFDDFASGNRYVVVTLACQWEDGTRITVLRQNQPSQYVKLGPAFSFDNGCPNARQLRRVSKKYVALKSAWGGLLDLKPYEMVGHLILRGYISRKDAPKWAVEQGLAQSEEAARKGIARILKGVD